MKRLSYIDGLTNNQPTHPPSLQAVEFLQKKAGARRKTNEWQWPQTFSNPSQLQAGAHYTDGSQGRATEPERAWSRTSWQPELL